MTPRFRLFFFFLFIFSGFSPIHFSSSMPNWATHVAAKHATTATTATTAIRLLCTGQAIGLKPSSGRTKREKRWCCPRWNDIAGSSDGTQNLMKFRKFLKSIVHCPITFAAGKLISGKVSSRCLPLLPASLRYLTQNTQGRSIDLDRADLWGTTQRVFKDGPYWGGHFCFVHFSSWQSVHLSRCFGLGQYFQFWSFFAATPNSGGENHSITVFFSRKKWVKEVISLWTISKKSI